MKYEEKMYSWTTLLTANIVITEKLNNLLVQRFAPKGGTKLAQGYNTEAEPIMLSVWYPDLMIEGIRADVRMEKRNDGKRRITFYPKKEEGLPMDLAELVKQVLRWVEACEEETDTILKELNEDVI